MIGLAVASIALPPLIFLLLVYANDFLSLFLSIPKSIDIVFSVLMIFTIFLVFPILISLTNDYFKKAGDLKKDIRLGFIYRFEGIPENRDNLLKKFKLPAMEENTKHIFEVLPGSGFLFSFNGNLLKARYEVEITEAVSAPENPFVISLPKDVLQADFSQNTELLVED